MREGTYDMNKMFASNAVGAPYVEAGKAECIAKLASKEQWMDEAQHGFKYVSPIKRCSTPGDAYATCAGKNLEAFPPMGTYPPRGVRQKVDVADLKDFRNIVTSPSKRGLGGYVGHPGVLLNPFPEHMPDDYDSERKAQLAYAAEHRAAQAANDEKCRYVSTVRSGPGPGHMEEYPSLCASSGVGVGPPSELETMNPKARADAVNAARPWTQGADKVWRFAQPTRSWKHHTLSPFPKAIPDQFDDKTIHISQTPMRRLGWHRHVAAGAISESLQERKPFRYSTNASRSKLSTSIQFSRSALRSAAGGGRR
jgi:hypothetical protein